MVTTVLTRKSHEYADVHTFYFKRMGLQYRSGMYAHLQLGSFFSRDGMREFSIASAPHEDELAFVAHVDTGSGFKRRLDGLQMGDSVRVYGISGHIALPRTAERPIQFIAGGVGMAPFRSLILTAAKQGGYRMHLLQVQRGHEFLYHDELAPLLQGYSPTAPEQFLSRARNIARERTDALFYVCGSKRFVDAARQVLLAAGIRRRDLQIENFR